MTYKERKAKEEVERKKRNAATASFYRLPAKNTRTKTPLPSTVGVSWIKGEPKEVIDETSIPNGNEDS